MSAGAHALRQFIWHLRARPQAAPAWLTPAEAALFQRMPPADQVEGLQVMRTLHAWGYGDDRELLAAGLLHDVGKSLAPPWVGYRVTITTLDALAPRVVGWLGKHPAGVLATLAKHAAIGGQLAAAAGLPESVVELIREHHGAARDQRMAALQRADGLH